MEGEIRENSEKEIAKTPFDALIVHVYFIDKVGEFKDGEPDFRPDIASNMNIITAAQIYKDNLAKKIIIPCGNATSKGAPPISEVFKKRLVKRYHIPEEDIITDDRAIDTRTESEIGLEIAKKEEFDNLLVLCLGFHKERVDKLYRILGADVTTTSAEKWLDKRSERHKKVVKGILASEWFKNRYLKREKKIKIVMLIDRKGKLMTGLGRLARGKGDIKNAFPRYPTESKKRN